MENKYDGGVVTHFSALVENLSQSLVQEPMWKRRGRSRQDFQPPPVVLFDVETHNQVILYKTLFYPHLDRQLKGKGQHFSFSSGIYIYHTSTNTHCARERVHVHARGL